MALLGTDRLLVVIDAMSSGAAKELKQLQADAKKTGDSFDSLGKMAGVTGAALKAGLVAGAGAFVGTKLVGFLQDSVQAFQESQEAAQQWARATNASVEEAGKFTTLMKSYGLGLEDLSEINAEFSQTIAKQPALLQSLGVEIQKNADGTTNMTATLVETLDALGEMPDGLAASQMAFKLFGEEGAKQLQGLYLAGIDVSDMMDRINFVDRSDEALAFKAATQEMDLAFQQLMITVGGTLVPALTAFIDAGMAVSGVLGDIPTSVYIVVGAFALLNTTMASNAYYAAVRGYLAVAEALRAIGPASAIAAAGFARVKAAAMTAGIIGAIIAISELALGLARVGDELKEFSLKPENAGKSIDQMGESFKKTDSAANTLVTKIFAGLIPGMDETEAAAMQVSRSMEEQAQATLDSATATDAQKAAAQGLIDVMGEGSRWTKTNNLRTEEGTAAMDAYRTAIEGAAGVSREAQEATQSLSDAIADIVVNGDAATATWDNVAGKAKEAAEAQGVQQEMQFLTNLAMAEYSTALETAAQAQERLNTLATGMTLGIGGTWSSLAGAAQDVAYKQYQQEAATNLAKTAMDRYAFSIQQVVAQQKLLAGAPGDIEDAINNIQTAFYELIPAQDGVAEHWEIIKDNAITAGNEQVGALSDARVGIETLIEILAAQGMPTSAIEDQLNALKATMPELADEFDAAIERIKGKANEFPLIDPKFDVAGIDAKVADLRARLATAQANQDWGLAEALTRELAEVDPSGFPHKVAAAIRNGDYDLAETLTGQYNAWAQGHDLPPLIITYDANGEPAQLKLDPLTEGKEATILYDADTTPAKGKVDDVTKDQTATITYNAVYHPDYNDMIMRMGYLGEDVDASINVTQDFVNGGYAAYVARMDFLSKDTTPDINVYQHFPNGGYSAYKARMDHLAMDRTAVITVQLRGAEAARNTINGLNADASTYAAAYLNAPTPRIVLPEINIPQPVNIVKVSVDGRELRAVVRDELRRAAPEPSGVL